MRIVLACSSFFGSGGGIASYNRELYKCLGSKGFDVLVVTTDLPARHDNTVIQGRDIDYYHTAIPERVADEPETAQKMFDRVVQYDPDVLISSDHIYLTSLFPCFADRRVRLSISHSYNETLPKVAACRRAYTDWIVVLSEAGKNYMTDHLGCIPEQVVVIYNAVEDIQDDTRKKIKAKADKDEIQIVYPGGSSSNKSPGVVLDVTRLLADAEFPWRMFWLGDARSYKNRIPQKIRTKIIFTGRIIRQAAEKYIDESDCFILPSKREGCPMSLMEAMRSGVIPIVSDCPSAMRELVKNGVSGYVVPRKDAAQIASCLKNIASDRSLKASLMHSARDVYEKELRVDVWINKILSLTRRRPGRCETDNEDKFNPASLCRWHRRAGRWFFPTITYLRLKFGYPNFSQIAKSSKL